ncbi:MAG: hypothetical protein ABJP34_01290 [Erythrobacter sp.]
MRALPVAAAALMVLTLPSAVHAQDASIDAPDTKPLSELSEKLADPAFQDQAAIMGEALVAMMLELPVGPMADAMNKATDGRTPAIDPDAKLRDIAPDAENMQGQVIEKLPLAMDKMSSMASGMEAMLPALMNMADQMRGAMERGKQGRERR